MSKKECGTSCLFGQSPGKTLPGVLHLNGLSSHMLLFRGFMGGIKPGPGGVARVFKEAGEDVVTRYLNLEVSGVFSDIAYSKER